jgi:AmmeMemoRadiSam system protein A
MEDAGQSNENLGVTSGGCANLLLSSEHREILLRLAASSIEHGLEFSKAKPVNSAEYPAELQILRPVFVTLKVANDLRGCVGTLEDLHPLVANVAKYAFKSAFSDPRFPKVNREEILGLRMQISILNQPEALQFSSENELVEQLRPGVDGLIFEERPFRSTLLPSAWEGATDKALFLAQLKRKAGFPSNYWSGSLKIHRYTTFCISD